MGKPSPHPLEKSTKDLLAEYGRFCVSFENSVSAMRDLVFCILRAEGIKKEKILETVFSGYTAEPIRALIFPLLIEHKSLDQATLDIATDILKFTQKLIQVRNDIVHSHWYVFPEAQPTIDYTDLTGFKYSKGKSGGGTKVMKYKKEDFELLTVESQTITDSFRMLELCVRFGWNAPDRFYRDSNRRFLPNLVGYSP